MPADWTVFFHALGFALLNSIWIYGLSWTIYRSLTERRIYWTPGSRYQLGILLLGAGSLVTIAIFLYSLDQPDLLTRFAAGQSLPPAIWQAAHWLPITFPFFAFAYLLVLPFKGLRLFRSLSIFKVRGIPNPIEPVILNQLKELSGQLGITRKIRFALSNEISTPLTYGCWKPVILFPLALAGNLSLQQTEALLLHELAHIRNNDYLIHLLLRINDMLFFFNPFAQKFIRAISLEQELRSDDLVTSLIPDKLAYAEALYWVGLKNNHTKWSFVLKASGDDQQLLFRISRIVDRNTGTGVKRTSIAQTIMVFASLLLCGITMVPVRSYFIAKELATVPHMPKTILIQKEEKVLSLAAAQKIKEKNSSPVWLKTKTLSTPLPVPATARLAAQQPYTFDQEGEQRYIATGNVMAKRDFTLELPDLSNERKEQGDKTEIRMEPFVPGNSFHYAKADEDVKIFLANYHFLHQEMCNALASAKREKQWPKAHYLNEQIRKMELRRSRIEMMQKVQRQLDTTLKVVSF